MSNTRSTPTICPHCSRAGRRTRYVHQPPAWVKVLFALRSGVKGDRTNTVGTVAQIAKRASVTRQRASLLVVEAYEHGVINLPFGEGTGIYRKTRRGDLLVQQWLRAGWSLGAQRVSQESARRPS